MTELFKKISLKLRHLAVIQIHYSHWLCTVIGCSVYSQITVGNVTLPKAVLSTANLFAVHYIAQLMFKSYVLSLNITTQIIALKLVLA